MKRRSTGVRAGAVLALALALSGCEGAIPPHLDPNTPEPRQDGTPLPSGSILGGDGIDVLGLLGRGEERRGGGGGIGVNGYLWRATLDTLSFMPLASADPFGGVIITDWHALADTPDDRFKMTVLVLGRELRPDGLRVSVFRQTRPAAGEGWRDATVKPDTATRLEDQILSRARQLRSAARAAAR